jgi:hypothetical protein
MKTKIRNSKSKIVYCATKGHGMEYTEMLDEAKRIAGELVKMHDGGFVKDSECIDARRLAVAISLFEAQVEDVFVPIKDEEKGARWENLRQSLGFQG